MRYTRSLAVTLFVAVCAGQGADLCADQADVKTIGPLSFAVPDGWKYETSAPDRAEMVWQNTNGAYLIILLTAPQPTSGAADRDFAIAWRTLVRKRGAGGGGNGRVQRRVGRVPRAAERQAHALPLRVLRAGPHRGHADDAPSGSVRGHGFQHCALCGAVRPRGAREVA